jgi:nanoRNase/pAp phosphatase (c-di-AMP/oligoRNAs hydrolase)
MLNSTEEFNKTINKSENILIFLPPSASDDATASSLAFYYFLKKLNKKTTFFHSHSFPEKLSFLPFPEKTTRTLAGSRDFKIIFQTEKNKIIDVQTQEKDNQYIIKVTPEKGSVNPKDFSFIPADFKFDLLFIPETPSLEELGELYHQNTDLFFEVPKINIDHHSSNDQYGQVNLIQTTASSISEILAEIILENHPKQIDKNIAQALLAGIISATESFQKPTTSPKAMAIAAELMKHQADQPTIIRHLYRTKSLPFLKLWGRVMARLNWDENKKAAWSLVSTEDFTQSQSDEKDIPLITEEVSKNFPQSQICAIIYTDLNGQTIGHVKINDEKKRKKFSQLYNISAPTPLLKITFPDMNLIEAEKDLLKKLEEVNKF